MGRKKNNDSWIALALESPWPVSATMAAAILVLGLVIFPMLVSDSKALTMILQGLRPVILLAAGAFGLVAFIKWLASLRLPTQRQAPTITPRHRPPPVVRPPQTTTITPRPEIRHDPILAAPPSPPAAPTSPNEWTRELLQDIEWKRFEDLCQKFYEAKGIRAACTPLGPDGGIDIRLYQDGSGQATAIVQCKAWGDSFVGVKPIRELLGVMVHEKVEKAFFMTSGNYSDEAKAFAGPNRITLIDGTLLLAMIKRLPEAAQAALLQFATAGDYNVPSCPSCGTKMRLVPGKEGKRDFWGCKSFPRCRQKLGVRRGTVSPPAAVYNY